MASTTIRAHGDKEYWDKVSLFAKRKKMSVAALVKDAVDLAYGTEIEASASLFLPNAVANQQHKGEADHV